jgi:pimeloyl-ACP methyl ester carboxylesterase
MRTIRSFEEKLHELSRPGSLPASWWSKIRASDRSRNSVPTLVIYADEELLTPRSESIAEGLPNATVCVVEGSGHALALESPGAVNDAIMTHLESSS